MHCFQICSHNYDKDCCWFTCQVEATSQRSSCVWLTHRLTLKKVILIEIKNEDDYITFLLIDSACMVATVCVRLSLVQLKKLRVPSCAPSIYKLSIFKHPGEMICKKFPSDCYIRVLETLAEQYGRVQQCYQYVSSNLNIDIISFIWHFPLVIPLLTLSCLSISVFLVFYLLFSAVLPHCKQRTAWELPLHWIQFLGKIRVISMTLLYRGKAYHGIQANWHLAAADLEIFEGGFQWKLW